MLSSLPVLVTHISCILNHFFQSGPVEQRCVSVFLFFFFYFKDSVGADFSVSALSGHLCRLLMTLLSLEGSEGLF